MNASVWRLKHGTEEMITRLAEKLSTEENVKIHLGEPVLKMEIDDEKGTDCVRIKAKSMEETFDLAISTVYSKC
jgi:phytoene dehydrogenase-like protein